MTDTQQTSPEVSVNEEIEAVAINNGAPSEETNNAVDSNQGAGSTNGGKGNNTISYAIIGFVVFYIIAAPMPDMSWWMWVIFAVIMYFGYGYINDFATGKGWNKAKKWSIIAILFGAVWIGSDALFGSGANESAGWEYVQGHLRSPSTASLEKVSELTSLESKLKDIPNLKIYVYTVDAQNGFGAMVREKYVVFFQDGEPKHLEVLNTLENSPQGLHNIRVALSMNGVRDAI